MIRNDFAGWYASRFPQPNGPRTVGREAELPLVTSDGKPGDARRLWKHIGGEGWTPTYDDVECELHTGFVHADGSQITTDAGVCTLEVVTKPCADLYELKREHERLVKIVVRAARTEDLYVLGHGIQPVAKGSRDLWMPKGRYTQALLATLGDALDAATITASDQLHVAVGAKELRAVIDGLNGLTSVIIALMANSTVYHGAPNGYRAHRERTWDAYADACRVGLAPCFENLGAWTQMVLAQRLICRRNPKTNRYEAPDITLGDFLAQCPSDKEALAAALFHEGCLWWDARPRTAYGTVEVRPACQQPPNEHWVLSALALGLVENHEAAYRLIETMDRGTLARLRLLAIEHGMDARGALEEALGMEIVHRTINCAADGLKKRGLGEEALLEPLYRRDDHDESPANRAIRSYEIGGIARLVRDFAYAVE